jgi:hypothetical protein
MRPRRDIEPGIEGFRYRVAPIELTRHTLGSRLCVPFELGAVSIASDNIAAANEPPKSKSQFSAECDGRHRSPECKGSGDE